jgi:hypothetical protein
MNSSISSAMWGSLRTSPASSFQSRISPSSACSDATMPTTTMLARFASGPQKAIVAAGRPRIHPRGDSGPMRATRDARLGGRVSSSARPWVVVPHRLARSIRDLQNIVHDLKSRGILLRASEKPIDTSTAAAKCFLDMLGVFGELRPTSARSANSRASRAGVAEVRRLKAEALPRLPSDGQVYRVPDETKQ